MATDQTPRWNRLDNAAKIFPPTMSSWDPKVFRFACELWEDVEPRTLQGALEKTIGQFPFYNSVLKKGVFWYYLEEGYGRPQVEEERLPPCAPIYSVDRKGPLFRVSYFGPRISLEVFHVLSDGTGALHFLRTLVCYYLAARHPEDFSAASPCIDYDASRQQRLDDSFDKYFKKEKRRAAPPFKRAYRIRGERLPEHRTGVIEASVSVRRLLEKARSFDATATEFMTAVLICAIRERMSVRDEKRDITVSVPVNLRSFFPSESARNFFAVVKIGYCFHGNSGELDQVVRQVKATLRRCLDPQRLSEQMNGFSALEHGLPVKLMPLAVKNPVLRIANWVAERNVTAALSNVGRIEMPQELAPRIRMFDAFISSNRVQLCTCSFGDRFTLSFTSPFVQPEVQRAFLRRLTGMGLDAEVTCSLPEEE